MTFKKNIWTICEENAWFIFSNYKIHIVNVTVNLIGSKSILISLFLVAARKDKQLYPGFIVMMLRKHPELIVLDREKRQFKVLDWEKFVKHHFEWRQWKRRKQGLTFELNKAKAAFAKAVTLFQRAKLESVIKNSDGSSSRIFSVLKDGIWKCLCEHVPVSF